MQTHDQLAFRATAGSLKQLMTNLAGDNGPEWKVALDLFLNRENPWPKKAGEFEVWRSVTIGFRSSVDSYLAALKAAKVKVWLDFTLRLKETLDRSMSAPNRERQTYELVKTSVAALGFKSNVTHRQLIDKIKDRGFWFCNPEIVLALRLDYLDQPAGESLHIPMDSVSMHIENYVQEPDEQGPEFKQAGLHLDYRTLGHPANANWYPENKIVLVKPKAKD